MNYIHLVQDTNHWWDSCEHNKEPLGSTIGRGTLLARPVIINFLRDSAPWNYAVTGYNSNIESSRMTITNDDLGIVKNEVIIAF
jgi:hypothetical protein